MLIMDEMTSSPILLRTQPFDFQFLHKHTHTKFKCDQAVFSFLVLMLSLSKTDPLSFEQKEVNLVFIFACNCIANMKTSQFSGY